MTNCPVLGRGPTVDVDPGGVGLGAVGVVGGASVGPTIPHRHVAQVDVAHYLPQLSPEAAHTPPAGGKTNSGQG